MSDLGRHALNASGIAVRAYEVFVVNEAFAKQLAAKYGAELEKLDDGWLVKKTGGPSSADDPITLAIRQAIKESGLA